MRITDLETSDLSALEASLEERRLLVEVALRRLSESASNEGIGTVVADSLLAPAKRVRPILSLLVTETLKGDREAVLPAACAVEMVHTASLILDDLPCMDDATTRRGRPTAHRLHGEANAILAAFALLNRAYGVVAEGWAGGPDASARAAMAGELASAVGITGMIAGQAMDLAQTGRSIDFPTLEFIHSRKTGALFIASARLGAIAAGARPAESTAISAYAKNLGLAFQVVDDLIDATGGEEAGKDVGQDARKTTFVTFSGVEGARQLARELIEASQEALTPFGGRARLLRDLARYVVSRRR
jgi:geranylgeranyl diphosphate synthase, type II